MMTYLAICLLLAAAGLRSRLVRLSAPSGASEPETATSEERFLASAKREAR